MGEKERLVAFVRKLVWERKMWLGSEYLMKDGKYWKGSRQAERSLVPEESRPLLCASRWPSLKKREGEGMTGEQESIWEITSMLYKPKADKVRWVKTMQGQQPTFGAFQISYI